MKTNYPSIEQIKELHHKYAPSERVFALVWQHSQIVAEIAEKLIKKNNLNVDRDFVRTGSLLHDIGAYLFVSPDVVFDKEQYIRHGYEGAQLLEKEGYPTELCTLVERHVGVGLTKELIKNPSLPKKDYLPQTVEEKLVLYADKFHTKIPAFYSVKGYKNYVANRFGGNVVKRFEKLVQEFGIPDLPALSKKYQQPIK